MIPNYTVVDIENDNTNMYERNAGNFMYDKIVAVGFKSKTEHKAIYHTENHGDWSQHIAADIQMLVGHNIKHDLLFLWKEPGIQALLQEGISIWDTQVVEYILSQYQVKYPKLRTIAVEKYGCPQRPKHIDELLFDIPEKMRVDYKQVSDIPKDLVLADVGDDVKDTEAVFLQQYDLIVKKNLLPVVQFEMNCLLGIIEMEYNGFRIDREKLAKDKERLEQGLDEANQELEELVKIYWKEFRYQCKFNPSSTHHVSLLFFGGKLPAEVDEVLLGSDGKPLVIKSGIKKGQVKTKKKKITIPVQGLVKPDQAWKTKREGIYQVNETVLKDIITKETEILEVSGMQPSRIQGLHAKEIAQIMLRIRSMEKEHKTYYVGIEDLTYGLDSSVHCNFNMVATETGRLSCNRPNLQNIPKSEVKTIFVSRF